MTIVLITIIVPLNLFLSCLPLLALPLLALPPEQAGHAHHGSYHNLLRAKVWQRDARQIYDKIWWPAALCLRGGGISDSRTMEQELKIWESQQERQARLARSRAAARGRGYSWQETLRRTWRSIKKVVWGNSGSRRIPHAAPPRQVPQRRKEAANASSGAHHIATGGAEGAWDWKQASKDLRKQHEEDMMQRRRAGASTALWREEFESKARPFSDSMSILTTHVDGRLRSAPCGITPQDIYDAVSEQSEADEEEAIAATEAHVASDAHVEICVDEHELAGISLDLPVMAMLLEREKVEAALISLRHLLLTPSTPQSSLIPADQLHKMSCPISASPCLAAAPLRATKLSGAKKDSAGNIHDACIGRHSADGSAAIPGSLQTSTRFHVNVGGALLLNQSVFRYTLNETLIRLQRYDTGTSPIPIRTAHASISTSTYAGIYELIRQLAPIAIEPFCISDVFNWKAAILSSFGRLMWVRRLHTHALLGSRLAARVRHLTPTGITEIDAHLALMSHVGVPTRSDELGEWRSAVDLVCAQGWHPSSPHLLPLPHTGKDEAIAATYPSPLQVLALAHTRGPCTRASPPEVLALPHTPAGFTAHTLPSWHTSPPEVLPLPHIPSPFLSTEVLALPHTPSPLLPPPHTRHR